MNPATELRGMTQELVMLDEQAAFEPKENEPVKENPFTRAQELALRSKINHQPGTQHKLGDVLYHVSASGAWLRQTPRKSARAAHRLAVASR